ncbi:MAG: GlsB/YeaQ/YmgE family stress response membrane protein [Armatimonadia bacterium]
MSIMGWILLGAIAGSLASVLMGESRGCLTNTLIGIVGALLGGFLFSTIGHEAITGFNFWSFFVAFIGSVILVMFFRAIRSPVV